MSYPLSQPPPPASTREYFAIYKKDPDEVLQLSINWTLIKAHGDDLATDSATSAAYPMGSITTASTELLVAGTSNDADISTTTINGGLDGGLYDVTVEVTTDGGATYERSMLVHCIQR